MDHDQHRGGPAPFFPPERHREVLQGCLDIPGQRPDFAIELTAVGISAKTVWVRLPEGLLPFTLCLEVELAADRRGIHMSRLEEAISALNDREFADLRDYARALAEPAFPAQGARWGRVELRGQLPRPGKTAVSGRLSLDALDLRVELVGELAKDPADHHDQPAVSDHEVPGERPLPGGWRHTLALEVGVHHITACPCTQAYNRLLLAAESRRPDSAPEAGGEVLQPTHSQRSHTRLTVSSPAAAARSPLTGPGVDDLLACLAAALHLSQDLLKRPDEAELVYAAHRRPQFAEDAVRETARMAGRILGGRLPAESRITITTVGLESIHRHDVHCRLDTSLDAILAVS